MRLRLSLSVLFLLFWISGGCSTLRRVDLSSYPPEERTLYLHNFTDESFQPDLNVELTRALREELERRDNFILKDKQSEARFHVYGSISVYRKEGRLYDNYRNPTRYELIVAARIRMRTAGEGSTDSFFLQRDVSASVDYSVREGYPETETLARMRLMRRLAARIHNLLEVGFVEQFGPPPQKVKGEEELQKEKSAPSPEESTIP